MIQQTLILIKPDGVQRGLIGEITRRFERVGLKIVGMKMIHIDEKFARSHYAEHVDKKFYPLLESMITMGPIVAMVLEGVESIGLVRKMVGATEPKTAAPGTIRGDYCHVSYGYADNVGMSIKNVVHASANASDSAKEIELWFDKKELFSYELVHDCHILQ